MSYSHKPLISIYTGLLSILCVGKPLNKNENGHPIFHNEEFLFSGDWGGEGVVPQWERKVVYLCVVDLL